MADADWPETLPQFVLQQGLSETLPDTTVASEMDAGPAKIRRRHSAGVENISCVVALKKDGVTDQVQILKDFYNNTLAGGSLPFDWIHPSSQAAVTFRFKPKKPPQIRLIRGTIWHAQLELEILP